MVVEPGYSYCNLGDTVTEDQRSATVSEAEIDPGIGW